MSNNATISLKHGNEYPYDRQSEDDYGENATPPVDRAHAAARGIIADLSDRRGIKHEIQSDDIDPEVRKDIVDSLAAIIRVAMDMPEPPAAKVKTLRDEFAMAMLGPIATTAVASSVTLNPAEVATLAYRFADAMLAARDTAT